MVNIALIIVSSLAGAFLALAFKNRKISQKLAPNSSSNFTTVSDDKIKNIAFYNRNRYGFIDVKEETSNINLNILQKIGCFLGVANDEKDSAQYTPTPMQDIDPEELA